MRLGRFCFTTTLHPRLARRARDDVAAEVVMLQNGNTLFQDCDLAAILSQHPRATISDGTA